MATVIKASCHDCGDVQLGVEDLSVRVCIESDAGSYVFRCPECRMSVAKPAERHVVDLLVSSGVNLVEWSLPAEMFELHLGEPITHDDLIDFHRQLQDDAWIDRLVAPLEGL